jgi:hypothetical protein
MYSSVSNFTSSSATLSSSSRSISFWRDSASMAVVLWYMTTALSSYVFSFYSRSMRVMSSSLMMWLPSLACSMRYLRFWLVYSCSSISFFSLSTVSLRRCFSLSSSTLSILIFSSSLLRSSSSPCNLERSILSSSITISLQCFFSTNPSSSFSLSTSCSSLSCILCLWSLF